MYISWNDFNIVRASDALKVDLFELMAALPGTLRYSLAPAKPATLRSPVICRATGNVYVAGMDEGGGGFPHNNTNKIFKIN